MERIGKRDKDIASLHFYYAVHLIDVECKEDKAGETAKKARSLCCMKVRDVPQVYYFILSILS